ncbi:hypothetical protein KGM_210286 [Danaus plexippus plexippus]|uniref:Uncharacterized protein n=1 Tax=Danaus plexippus plexippus TaxID=278856 RepID=A0A212FPQ3_DANPL|nr:hypothetical protein KGM_210286 [Danaus plexippus plexippus]
MSVITSQPLPNSDDNLQPEASPEQMTDEEEEERKKQRQREDCCMDALDCEDSDIFFLCHCIAWCFRGIGNCTESSFDDCGDCISNCCESSNDTTDADSCTDCMDCCSN